MFRLKKDNIKPSIQKRRDSKEAKVGEQELQRILDSISKDTPLPKVLDQLLDNAVRKEIAEATRPDEKLEELLNKATIDPNPMNIELRRDIERNCNRIGRKGWKEFNAKNSETPFVVTKCLRKSQNRKRPDGVDPTDLLSFATSLYDAPITPYQEPQTNDCNLLQLSNYEVGKVIGRLAKNKAPGPNGIRNEVYQSLAATEKGLEVVTQWINGVLSGNFPLPSRNARLGAIPKKQFSTKPEDMRLLAMMNTDAKIIELCLKHLIRKNATTLCNFHESQAGFTDQRSALEQALKLRLRSEKAKKNGEPYYALLLDLKKAFDSVPQSMILMCLKEKAEQLPIPEKPAALQIASFITRWLQEETKGLVFNDDGTETGTFLFRRGVPQGGVLSPWLFNLCIDELLKTADDICLAGKDHQDIQKAAHFADNWILNNGMQLSYSKCESINLGKKEGSKPFVISNAVIKETDAITYLGARLSPDWSLRRERCENQELNALMGKYSSLSPKRTAIVLRAIRWGRLLYSSELLPLSKETLEKEQSIFDKAVLKQSKYMHNHLVSRDVGCDFLVKAEHAIRILNFARRMYRTTTCPEMKDIINSLIDENCTTPGTYMADIKSVLDEFEIDIADAITAPETQAREYRSKIRCHVALSRQRDTKEKLEIHNWREKFDDSPEPSMSSLFNYPNSVALFHFRLPSLEIGCHLSLFCR
eukprot:GHVP01035903.1.p1 GENE.GHVP01035903.1~~GHVP01035903.1.p1  ORF type:complete len:703 (+),score=105.49 GHVP01035903.1:1075-3183(+)